jgi:hypothetical protein
MKRSILTFTCLLILAASCTPLPQQQVVLVTAAPGFVATTRASTNRPTPTTAPTNTPALTATPTNTPTPPATPTPAYPAEWAKPPEGKVYFQSDLVNLDRTMFPQHVDKKQGADFETGNFQGFGPGLRAYPKGQAVKEANGEILRRGYPTFYPWNLQGGYSVAMTVMVVPDSEREQVSGGINQTDRWFSLLGIYGWREEDDPNSVGAAILTSVILPFGQKYRASLHIGDITTGSPQWRRAELVDSAPYFEFGKKYRLEIVVDQDRNVRLYQTDLEEASPHPRLAWIGKLDDSAALGLKGGHGGYYSNSDVIEEVYNGDFVIKRLTSK